MGIQTSLLHAVLLASALRTLIRGSATPTNSSRGLQRKERLGFFNWVQFSNEPCDVGDGLRGVCFTSAECSLYSGRVLGSCAQGYGVCCQVTRTCGQIITFNNSYFVDPTWIGGTVPNGGHCSVVVLTGTHVPVCQLKLDLERFDIVGPDVFGHSGGCTHDSFAVTGHDSNGAVPVICGVNHGQHMYVSVTQPSGPVQLSVSLAANVTQRTWKIRVIQIPCGSPRLAPAGCLQYQEEPSGLVSSFNYDTDSRPEGGYPNHLRYSVCFRKAHGTCTVRFSKQGPFGVGARPRGAPDEVLINRCQNFELGSPAQGDFLLLGVQPYCGDDFPPYIETVDTGIVIVTFVSNGTHSPLHKGFQLRYTMAACVCPTYGLGYYGPATRPPEASYEAVQLSQMYMTHVIGGSGVGVESTTADSSDVTLEPQSTVMNVPFQVPVRRPTKKPGKIIIYRKGEYKNFIRKLFKNFGASQGSRNF